MISNEQEDFIMYVQLTNLQQLLSCQYDNSTKI